jgi:predicted CopG family antitoxin
MHRKMTITLDEAVYDGLYRTTGRRHISQFIEDLVKTHMMNTSLDEGYLAMAADEKREIEAMEWCNALVGDMDNEAMADQIMAADKSRIKNQLDTLSKTDMLAVEDAMKDHLALPR